MLSFIKSWSSALKSWNVQRQAASHDSDIRLKAVKAASKDPALGDLVLNTFAENPFNSTEIGLLAESYEGLASQALEILEQRIPATEAHVESYKNHLREFMLPEPEEAQIKTRIENYAINAASVIGKHASVAADVVKIHLRSTINTGFIRIQNLVNRHPSKATEIIDVLKESGSERAIQAIIGIAFEDLSHAFRDLNTTDRKSGAIFEHAVAALQQTNLDTHIDYIQKRHPPELSLILCAHLYKGLDGPIQDTIRKAAQTLTDQLLDPAALLKTLSNKAPPPALLKAFEAVDDSGMFQNNNGDVSLVNLYQDAIDIYNAQQEATIRSLEELKRTAHGLNP